MRPLRGILLKIASVVVFIVMAAIIKSVSDHVPGGQAVFFRSLFAIPVIVVWLMWRHELRTGLKTNDPLGHVWRGFAGTLAMGLGFAGLAYLPLPEVTAIGYAAPLLTDWIGNHVEKPLIVGPDEESEQRAGSIASRIGVPHAVRRKTRHGGRSVDIAVPDLSVWRDRTPVLVDGIASSGRTLAVAAHKLAEQGMRKPECVVVHALFAEDAWAQLTPLFARITSTDAVPHPSNRIGLASLIADALSSGKTDPRG